MEDLALHILDLIQNSVRAKATRVDLTIEEKLTEDLMRISIWDNGQGMSRDFCQKALDPFTTSRTTRRVGLGLPLFSMTARQCEGDLKLTSLPGEYTHVEVFMKYSHWDRPPLGDMAGTIVALLVGNPQLDFLYQHSFNGATFTLDTREIREAVGPDLQISALEVLDWIREYIQEGLAEIYGGEEDAESEELR